MSEALEVRVFAPASVSNVACGFDVLGFALAGLGDVVQARHATEPGIAIAAIRGDNGRLPLRWQDNTAGRAARAVIEHAVSRGLGVEIEIEKHMPLSSGLGSSAASAVAAAVAVDRLLGTELSHSQLLLCALEGEMVASGSAHADNLAPSLYGGLVLVRSLDPAPDVVPLPIPEGLSCALIRPHVEVETRAARQKLGDSVPLRAAVQQSGNLGALVSALFRSDLELLSRALVDAIAEPVRASDVPGFAAVKAAALEVGALGCSLSGSGPAIFALCRDSHSAEQVADAMASSFERAAARTCDRFSLTLDQPGARVLSCAS